MLTRRKPELAGGLLESRLVEERKSRRVNITGAPGQLAFVKQMQKIVLHLLFCEKIRRFLVICGQPRDRCKIQLLGFRGQPPELHVLDHPLS